MKIANIIVVHKNPQQLARMLSHFNGEQFHHFIHIDRRVDIQEYSAVTALPNVTLLRRIKVNWSGYGFVEVVLDGFSHIAARKSEFMYVNVMSGQDYPVRPTHHFYEYLLNADRKEFFEVAHVDTEWPIAMHRYQRFHLIEWKVRGRYRLEDFINIFVAPRTFYKGKLQPYGKSAWFTASVAFVQYALNYMRENPDYERFLRTVWNPDEFTFNTLVMNSPFRERLVNSNLRNIDWSEGNANPKIFRVSDVPGLIQGECFMARKFDTTVDAEVLDLLDQFIAADTFSVDLSGVPKAFEANGGPYTAFQ